MPKVHIPDHGTLTWLIGHRTWLLGVTHAALFALSYSLAFALRFDFAIPREHLTAFWVTLPAIVGLKLAVFSATGQLHGWWRIVTFRDLIGIEKACLICLFVLAAAGFFSNSISIPRSVLVFDSLFTLVIVGALRSTWRLFDEVVRPKLASDRYAPAALIGMDAETVFLAGQIQSHGRLPLRVCGLISERPISFKHRQVGGFSILGDVAQIESIAKTHRIKNILVHTELLPGKSMRELMDTCARLGIALEIVPKFEHRLSLSSQASGRTPSRIPTREINIEDLLRRDVAELDLGNIRELIRDKAVLVTGAGGSIGSEICRQLMQFDPRQLVLLGRGENRIFQIEQELLLLRSKTSLSTVIADIRDRERIEEVFAEYDPSVVFHAAAHKHVPLMERNIREAILNNVIGTKTVVDAADKFETEKFVMISSDKAVRPSSIMGATKRVAEMYVAAVGAESNTQFMSVRFGNVLGSAGSVVPIFTKQIERGGPITVTDERMTRFFMTIPEASQLVLQAASMGVGGDLFVLDMGSPVRIVDLARDLIQLSGLPTNAIDIVFSGIRPGEKLHEELAEREGEIDRTTHPKILSIRPVVYDKEYVIDLIDSLASPMTSEDAIRRTLLSLDREPNPAMHLSSEIQNTAMRG